MSYYAFGVCVCVCVCVSVYLHLVAAVMNLHICKVAHLLVFACVHICPCVCVSVSVGAC